MKRPDRAPLIGLFATAAIFVALFNLTPISESDFWLQLKVGSEIRETHAIPPTIEYAFTEARDLGFIAHEWLSSVATSALFARVGYAGMIVFKCVLSLAVTGLAFALAYRLTKSAAVSVAIALAASWDMNFRFQMRPEIFAFLLAFGTTLVLSTFVETGRRRLLVALAPLALVWANAHASILVGLGLPWIFLAGTAIDDLRARRAFRLKTVQVPLAAAGISMFLASLANPYGIHLLLHWITFGRGAWLRTNIVEFSSTFSETTRRAPYFWVYLAYALLVAAVALKGRKRLDGTSLLLLAIFGAMSLDAVRFTAWFALAGTYAMGRALAGAARTPAAERRWIRAGIAVSLIGIAVALGRGDVRGHRIGFRNEAPMSEAAIRFLHEQGIQGNVFNTFSHGDQLIFNFYPRMRVVIDSRTDAYGEAYYLRYRDLCGRSFKALGPPADLVAFLVRYGVTTIVTRPLDFKNWSDKGHVAALEGIGFGIVYADPTTVILRRGT